jgi:hypothetical protein
MADFRWAHAKTGIGRIMAIDGKGDHRVDNVPILDQDGVLTRLFSLSSSL